MGNCTNILIYELLPIFLVSLGDGRMIIRDQVLFYIQYMGLSGISYDFGITCSFIYKAQFLVIL